MTDIGSNPWILWGHLYSCSSPAQPKPLCGSINKQVTLPLSTYNFGVNFEHNTKAYPHDIFFFLMHNSLSFCVKHHAYMPSMKITARMAYGFGIMTNKHHILLMILMWLGSFAFHVNCIVCLENEEHTKFWLPMWQIKFRVQSVSYPPIPVEQPKESKPFAPMLITVSILFTIFLPLLSSLPWFMHFCEYFKLQEIYGFLNCTYWKYLCSWW